MRFLVSEVPLYIDGFPPPEAVPSSWSVLKTTPLRSACTARNGHALIHSSIQPPNVAPDLAHAGVPHLQENAPHWDPTLGLCLRFYMKGRPLEGGGRFLMGEVPLYMNGFPPPEAGPS